METVFNNQYSPLFEVSLLNYLGCVMSYIFFNCKIGPILTMEKPQLQEVEFSAFLKVTANTWYTLSYRKGKITRKVGSHLIKQPKV